MSPSKDSPIPILDAARSAPTDINRSSIKVMGSCVFVLLAWPTNG
jgi:hypothetical protein